MSFRFPLAAVLRVRELAAEAEERTLARILAELEALRQALAGTEKELREAAEARETAFATAALPAMHLHSSYAATDALRGRQSSLAQQIAALELLRAQQVARYEEAYRRREVLATLRDRERENWLATQGKREQKAADEAFLNKRQRQMRNGRAN